MRVAFLIGAPYPSTIASIEAVCRMERIEPVLVLLDTYSSPISKRVQNLRRNLRRNGLGYLPSRALLALRGLTDRLADQPLGLDARVAQTLRTAFPDRCFALEDLTQKFGMPLVRAGNLNSPEAAARLAGCRADLGIVLGTRILRESTFGVPNLGCINVHKGKVPEYRGMPPGFWEIFDGAKTAGITVHQVARQLDAGDIVETGEVPIGAHDTPETLATKLDLASIPILVRAVEAIRTKSARSQTQPHWTAPPRTKPTLEQERALRARLTHWTQTSAARATLKNCFYLALFHAGIYETVRRFRRRSRAAILLYHRVNQYSRDVLTVDPETFAAQLIALQDRYPMSSTGELVEKLENGNPLSPTTVAIHFDDCYLDVHTFGRPILQALGLRAAAFINPGYLASDRVFEHDAACAFVFPNCRPDHLQEWVNHGFEIGAHTVNHVDLGCCDRDRLTAEIADSGKQLAAIIEQPVTLFSYPYGRPQNITAAALQVTRESSFRALFSAYGGFVSKTTDLFDIPRMGVSLHHRPLWLLMEIEGLSLAGLKERLPRLSRFRRRRAQAVAPPAASRPGAASIT